MPVSLSASLLFDIEGVTFAFAGVWYDLAVEELRVVENDTRVVLLFDVGYPVSAFAFVFAGV